MKLKKYIVLLLTLFVSFGFVYNVEALEFDIEETLVILKEPEEFNPGNPAGDTNDIVSNTSSGDSSSDSWCTKFNNVWYVFGIAIQIIYVATPLLLIVTGSITMLQAMTKHDPGAVNKAQKALVNKIIAAVVVFLMISIVKMVTAFVADDGWVSCANCAFNPSESNCAIKKVETGIKGEL